MKVINDNKCSWVNDLNPRTNIKTLTSNINCEWLVIGAGYTGLSAARKLGQLHKNKKILLIDAQIAGEGASARNSGFLSLSDSDIYKLVVKVFFIINFYSFNKMI